MKIVHIHHHYWPVVGGLENVVKALAEGMARLGYEVHVVTSPYRAESRPREEVVNGVYVHRVKAIRFKYPDLIYPLEIPRGLLKDADVVHGYSQNSLFTYLVCREAKRLNKHIVMYFLGVDYLRNHYNPLIKVFGYHYQKWITRRVIKITDLALVTNSYERRLLKERYGIESYVLPHGVDKKYLDTSDMSNTFKEKYEVRGRIIAYIGRIHPTKGLDLLVRAFAMITGEVPDATLVIAGKGSEKYLRKCLELAEKLEIGSKIRYLGYISEEDKIGLIDASDVIVLPSKHAGESYPLIVDEVKARRKPLVVTNYGSLPHRIINGVEGVIVHADPKSLAEGIMQILFNVGQYYPVSKICTWTDITKELVKMYSSLLT
jgi:glycosyltransferase involved in cell wall biosynthesis